MFSITCSACSCVFESESSRTEFCPVCSAGDICINADGSLSPEPGRDDEHACVCCGHLNQLDPEGWCEDCSDACDSHNRGERYYGDDDLPIDPDLQPYEELPAEGEVIEAWRLTPKTREALSIRMAAKYTEWLATQTPEDESTKDDPNATEYTEQVGPYVCDF